MKARKTKFKKILVTISCLIILLATTITSLVIYLYYPLYRAHINTKLVQYDYLSPANTKEHFVVYIDSPTTPSPSFIKTILKKAFYDKHVVFSTTQPPHMFVLNVWGFYTSNWFKLRKHHAPYIIFSEESHRINPPEYNKTSPLPFLEILSFTPQNQEHLHFPFVGWNGIKPERKHTNTNRKKFLAYISSRCFQHRDELFQLITKKQPGAEALGTCSNNKNITPTADYNRRWHDLPAVYSQYNFAIVMENSEKPGYISEKILTVFRGGAIPIFWGR